MRNLKRYAVVGALGAVSLGGVLSACGESESSTGASFTVTGSTLSIVNDTANMPVRVASRPDGASPTGRVDVTVATSTVGKNARTPAWSLSNDTLHLGTPCDTGWIGYCEGTYTVTVPHNVQVRINGKPAGVG